jgi:hypothetical protein
VGQNYFSSKMQFQRRMQGEKNPSLLASTRHIFCIFFTCTPTDPLFSAPQPKERHQDCRLLSFTAALEFPATISFPCQRSPLTSKAREPSISTTSSDAAFRMSQKTFPSTPPRRQSPLNFPSFVDPATPRPPSAVLFFHRERDLLTFPPRATVHLFFQTAEDCATILQHFAQHHGLTDKGGFHLCRPPSPCALELRFSHTIENPHLQNHP